MKKNILEKKGIQLLYLKMKFLLKKEKNKSNKCQKIKIKYVLG